MNEPVASALRLGGGAGLDQLVDLAGSKPAASSTSRVCSPSAGAGRVASPGVRENLTGMPSRRTGPSSG